VTNRVSATKPAAAESVAKLGWRANERWRRVTNAAYERWARPWARGIRVPSATATIAAHIGPFRHGSECAASSNLDDPVLSVAAKSGSVRTCFA
jgi:hypothetical protein